MNEQTETASVNDLRGRTVIDNSGDKVGTVVDVYADDDTRQPEWLAVSTGLFGTKISFVPLSGAAVQPEGDLVVAYDKSTIKDSPRMEADGHLEENEEQQLYAHYGRQYDAMGTRNGNGNRIDETRNVRTDRDDTSASMVRSEEEISVDKRRQEAGRVKLRKWVETEDVHFTVPVQRQMAKVVREPVAEGDRVDGNFENSEDEIVLSEEVVDVNKRVVGKERIGLQTETVTEQVPVDEKVRKERVEVDGDRVTDDRTRSNR